MFFRKILLLLALNVIVLPGQINLVKSQSLENRDRLAPKRPTPPRRIPPNKVKPGGGLDFGQQACSQGQKSLIALIPVENPVLTAQSHPSFLFYIPDSASAISHGEFSLFTTEEKTRIYSTEITLDSTPGIIKIDLPPSPQYALQTDKPYHWYFKVYCQKELGSQTFLDVDGWIERVALTPSRVRQIEAASPEIWYDAIAQTAKSLIAAPQDPAVRDRWFKLLQHINREHLFDVGIQSVTTKTNELSQQD